MSDSLPNCPFHAYALTGDLVSSRKAENRQKLGDLIRRCLKAINARFSNEFYGPLALTRGIDELSALLRRPRAAFDMMVAINLAVWPETFRFALAEGTIDVVGSTGRSADMDGSAFHRGADAQERARENKLMLAVHFDSRDAAETQMVEQMATLYCRLMETWTPGVAPAIRHYRPLDGSQPTQAQVARVLNCSQQAVSEAHRRGHLDVLLATERVLRNGLDFMEKPS